ncbi:MAG: hypothetical protein ACRECX_15180 [Methyloceanibacter sp.]|uniref:hypothetical protein n=1 Tax=Methyloceanibacter sp. TaxID=1965321 RepID=UPI003D6D65AD
MVVLTVGGLVGKPNRGPFDAKRDSLLASLKADFKHAFEFDRAMLLALPQGEVVAQPPEFDKPATFSGPLLREVLGFIEAAKVKTSFVAADGYAGFVMPEDIDGSDWILALSADGKPLGIGQQGPIWLLNTRAEGKGPRDDHRGHWVWAVVYMHVGE